MRGALAGLPISSPGPLTPLSSEQRGRIGRCPISGLLFTSSFLLLKYRRLELGQVFHEIFQIVRLILSLHQIVLNSDGTPLAPLLGDRHFKELPCIVLENPQVLIHDILIDKVIIDILKLLLLRYWGLVHQPWCLALLLTMGHHLELVDVPPSSSLHVQSPMH